MSAIHMGKFTLCNCSFYRISLPPIRDRFKGVNHADTPVRDMMNLATEQLAGMKEQLANRHWVDFAQVYPEYLPSLPKVPYPDVAALPETDPITNEWQ